jgi:hypothetical protein
MLNPVLEVSVDEKGETLNALEVLFGQIGGDQFKLEVFFDEHEDLHEPERIDPQFVEWFAGSYFRCIDIFYGRDALDQNVFNLLRGHGNQTPYEIW